MQTATGALAAVGASALLLLLASCASSVDHGGPDPGLRGEWVLNSATDTTGVIPLGNQRISLTIDGDTSTTGRSPCSDYTARVYGTLSALWITAAIPRARPCGTAIQAVIEHRYLVDLNRVRSSHVIGGVLDLTAPGLDLTYERTLAVPLDRIVDRTWKLSGAAHDSYYATINPSLVAEQGAIIRFGTDGTLEGETGCRSFIADYLQNAGEIVVTHLIERDGGPCDPDAQISDDQLIRALKAGFAYSAEAGALQLTSPRSALVLTFID